MTSEEHALIMKLMDATEARIVASETRMLLHLESMEVRLLARMESLWTEPFTRFELALSSHLLYVQQEDTA